MQRGVQPTRTDFRRYTITHATIVPHGMLGKRVTNLQTQLTSTVLLVCMTRLVVLEPSRFQYAHNFGPLFDDSLEFGCLYATSGFDRNVVMRAAYKPLTTHRLKSTAFKMVATRN
mmetsp:Transcript_41529/g.74515  ORF Transcript_41529/g.74515 Transcript_41529/m.74515 type:complete len:115 (-) Transcript_41529:114-458(-)